MEHSRKFEAVRRFYAGGYWPKSRVRDAVAKQWITPAEFEEITGEGY